MGGLAGVGGCRIRQYPPFNEIFFVSDILKYFEILWIIFLKYLKIFGSWGSWLVLGDVESVNIRLFVPHCADPAEPALY